jgi:hypothetical protein
MRSTRLSSLVVLVLVLVLGCASMLAGAAPSSAFTTCPPGMVSYGVGVQYCLDPPTGLATAPNGVPVVKATPLTVPASLEAAVQDSSATTAAKVGMVVQDAATANGAMAVAGKAVGGASLIVTAGITGFQLGQLGTSLLCKAGASVVCMPKSQTYTPNVDVVVVNDPGWVPASGSIPAYNSQPARSFSMGWASPPGVPSAPFTSGAYIAHMTYTPTTTVNAGGHYADVFGYDDTNTQVWGGFANSCPNTCSVANGNAFDLNFTGKTVPSTVKWFLFDFKNTDNNTFGTAAVVKYYMQGSAQRPPATDPNPPRTLITRNICVNAGGSTQTINGPASASFTETASTLPSVPAAPSCPSGFTVSSTSIVEVTPNLPDKTVWGPYVVPQAVVNARTGATFPNCANTLCHTRLFKVNSDGSLSDCFAASTDCAKWFTDPNKTTDYKCTYGPAGTSADPVVSLSECNYYSPSFDAQEQAQGVPYGDPATGAVPDTLVTPTTVPSPTGDVSCWPSGGWDAVMNPQSWVLAPIKCAMTWAFVPDESTLTGLQTQIRTALDSSGIGAWFSAVGGLFGGLNGDGSSGCAGPAVHLSLPGVESDQHPFSACDPPMSVVATFSYALSTIVVVVAGGLAGLKAVGSGFGFPVTFGRSTGTVEQ